MKGCILEVHLEYPKELHELHNDYPLPPDKLEIKTGIFSDFYQELLMIVILLLEMSKKLFPNFFDKGKYLLHYKNLQLYLRLGLKMGKMMKKSFTN